MDASESLLVNLVQLDAPKVGCLVCTACYLLQQYTGMLPARYSSQQPAAYMPYL